MSLPVGTTWELRSTGATTNGGGFFDYGGDSVDYSQQAAAQLTLTDVACVEYLNIITSVAGGFTAAMIGNMVQIASGTNFVAGFYLIIGVVSTNSVILDRSPVSGGDGSSGNGKVGGALDSLEVIASSIDTGHTVWVKDGTYTSTGVFTISSGDDRLNQSELIRILGYDITRGDAPSGTGRPLLALSTYTMTLGDDGLFANFRLTGNPGNNIPMVSGGGAYLDNVEFDHQGDAGPGTARLLNNAFAVNNCLFKATGSPTLSYGIYGNVYRVEHSYFDGLDYGIYNSVNNQAPAVLESCIFDGCEYGIQGVADSIGCVYYNCTNGFYVQSNGQGLSLMNSIFSECDVGVYNHVTSFLLLQNNHYYNNTADLDDIGHRIIEYGKTTGDPKFVNPGADDFDLQAGSPCEGAGFAMRVGVG